MMQKSDCYNFIFLGEAGCGKSEVAINTALRLASKGDKEVHFFDLDMTKPLFRSRDLNQVLKDAGVIVHFVEQFMDAPTTSGGVNRMLRDDNCYVVMDVGGDYIGARSIGGYAPAINKEKTAVFYIVNPYRPWSLDIEHVNKVFGEILTVSHIQLDKVQILGNPNIGLGTGKEEVLRGISILVDMITPYKPLVGLCVHENISLDAEQARGMEIWPMHLYMSYPWADEENTLA
ncbi:hypothetical protein [Anaerotignum sp.]|uniref:hypothetical protein n=1 Tax=Anaerotignum sp. TaxID=2039241 RepID=UPI0027147CBE|nr:hypothetical protein [Anaerotignum sp.]